MKVVIANFSRPINKKMDYKSCWRNFSKPKLESRTSLFDYDSGWGFHIYAIGIYLMDQGIADEVEFWNFGIWYNY